MLKKVSDKIEEAFDRLDIVCQDAREGTKSLDFLRSAFESEKERWETENSYLNTLAFERQERAEAAEERVNELKESLSKTEHTLLGSVHYIVMKERAEAAEERVLKAEEESKESLYKWHGAESDYAIMKGEVATLKEKLTVAKDARITVCDAISNVIWDIDDENELAYVSLKEYRLINKALVRLDQAERVEKI